jgi:hypothetical protein
MLPEIFCRAKNCACKPPTAVFSASKIPITIVSTIDPTHLRPQSRETVASAVPDKKVRYIVRSNKNAPVR